MASPVTLAAVARAAKLPPVDVTKQLFADHGVMTVAQLKTLLADADAARTLPPQWRDKLLGAVDKLTAAAGISFVQWRPNGRDTRPRVVILQGDLTECPADAIVNAANSHLSHGGGLAGAIARRGGRAIVDECNAWIREHRTLPVGDAMVTSAGKLPCRFVIHTVGPRIFGNSPTEQDAQQLRNAVWSVLSEAEKLGLATIAIPGISSGIFGYPRDLAAREIFGECVRFCRERSIEASSKTTLETIALMNNDTPTCTSFLKALHEVAGDAVEELDSDPFEVTDPDRPQPSAVSVSERDLADAVEQIRLE